MYVYLNVHHIYLASPMGATPLEFLRDFWHQQTRVPGQLYGIEAIKEVRKKALDELEKDKGSNEGEELEGNYRIIVVGQQTMKPRAVRVPLRK